MKSIIGDYGELHAALRARAEALPPSHAGDRELIKRMTRAGFTKLLNPETFGILLKALGVKLIMISDDSEAAMRLRKRIKQRDERRVTAGVLSTSWSDRIYQEIERDFLRQIGAKGGKAPRRLLPAKRRSSIARHAAMSRWKRVRQSQEPTPC